jgi:hypothetical protein
LLPHIAPFPDPPSPGWFEVKIFPIFQTVNMKLYLHLGSWDCIWKRNANIPAIDKTYTYYSKLGALVWNILRTCTILLPTTTNMKNMIRLLLMGGSSTCSPALPIGTCPRLLIFLSNLVLRLRRLRGAGCVGLIRKRRGDDR